MQDHIYSLKTSSSTFSGRRQVMFTVTVSMPGLKAAMPTPLAAIRGVIVNTDLSVQQMMSDDFLTAEDCLLEMVCEIPSLVTAMTAFTNLYDAASYLDSELDFKSGDRQLSLDSLRIMIIDNFDVSDELTSNQAELYLIAYVNEMLQHMADVIVVDGAGRKELFQSVNKKPFAQDFFVFKSGSRLLAPQLSMINKGKVTTKNTLSRIH